MTDDQLEALIEKLDARMEKRLAKQDDRMERRFAEQDMRFDKHLKQELEQSYAKFFGQVIRHVDQRIDSLETTMTAGFDRIYSTLDSITKRVDDDDKDRAVITHEQKLHGKWIGQLSKATKTKLVSER